MTPFLKNPNTTDWAGPDGALSMIGVGLNKEEVMKQTYSYRTKDWRYIRYMDRTEELYDHKNNPYEWNNLAEEKDFQTVKEELYQQLLVVLKD